MKCWLALAQLTQDAVKRDMKSGVRAFTLFHAMVLLLHLTNAIYFKAVHAFLIRLKCIDSPKAGGNKPKENFVNILFFFLVYLYLARLFAIFIILLAIFLI